MSSRHRLFRIAFVAVAAALAVPVGAARGATACVGDCNRDGAVTIDELMRGVGLALGQAPIAECPEFDCNGEGVVTVDCLLQGVKGAVDGCEAPVANPTLEGPVTSGHGPFVAGTTFDLSQVGYEETEFFVAGTAAAYTNVGALGDDGKWTAAKSGDTAAYRTRMLVYRPIDPQQFNGTVVVEWLNVSGGLDASPDWTGAHTELIRRGYAWVGVSAQKVGIEGGSAAVQVVALPLKKVDPVRYGSLTHPGDSFSYDIFAQVGVAVRHPRGVSPLGDLPVERVIAAGESQSAFRMVTYINAIHPLARVFDGFLVHSRGSIGAPLSEAPQPLVAVPDTALIRDDVDVPVLIFQTETDLTLLNYLPARQPDTDRIRTWEVAGTAHADLYTLATGPTDLGDSPDAAKLVITSMPIPGVVSCPKPINDGPQHFVLNAAVDALERWVRDGTLPPTAPRLDVEPGPPVTLRRDAHGNALGGIRTPQVDVPIAAFAGDGQEGSLLCLLFGTTNPFDAPTLAALYPDHAAYVDAFEAAADRAVEAGFVLPVDADLMKAAAAMADVPPAE
jgi:Alpha/beta hydrolase domain